MHSFTAILNTHFILFLLCSATGKEVKFSICQNNIFLEGILSTKLPIPNY